MVFQLHLIKLYIKVTNSIGQNIIDAILAFQSHPGVSTIWGLSFNLSEIKSNKKVKITPQNK